MTEISDALIRDIQAAMGALVRQQRPGLSHEVVQLDMRIGQMKTLFILWTAGKPQTMGQLAHALDVSLGTVTGLIEAWSNGAWLVARRTRPTGARSSPALPRRRRPASCAWRRGEAWLSSACCVACSSTTSGPYARDSSRWPLQRDPPRQRELEASKRSRNSASRFTSAPSNRALDTMLDDAQARRFAAGGGH